MRDWLIHLLGGLTVQESRESDNNSFAMGRYMAFADVKKQLVRSRSGMRMELNKWVDEQMRELTDGKEA